MTEFALEHNSVSAQSVNDPGTIIPKFTPFFLLYPQFLFKKKLAVPSCFGKQPDADRLGKLQSTEGQINSLFVRLCTLD